MFKFILVVLKAFPSFFLRTLKLKKMNKNLESYKTDEPFKITQEIAIKANKASFHAEVIPSYEEKLPEGQVLFIPNHTSIMDCIFMYQISDRPFGCLAKSEAIKYPLFGTIIKANFGAFIDRSDLRSQIKVFMSINKLLESRPDLSFVAFPEGTRSRPTEFKLGEFKPGLFKIAVRRNIPIVPMAMFMPERVLDPKYIYKKYPVQIRYLKPIMPNEYQNWTTEQISDEVKRRIEVALNELKANDRELVKKLNNYSDEKVDKVLYKKGDKKY